jgi:hypothetical protein
MVGMTRQAQSVVIFDDWSPAIQHSGDVTFVPIFGEVRGNLNGM